MRSEGSRSGAVRLALAAALLCCVAAWASAASAEEPLSVTYGPQASTGEGTLASDEALAALREKLTGN